MNRQTGKAHFAEDVLSREFERTPYLAYDEWRTRWKVRWFSRNKAWVVIDYATAVAILKAPQAFSSAVFEPLTSRLLHASDPPHHTELRHALVPLFTATRQKAARDYARQAARDAAARASRRGSLELVSEYAHPVVMQVACTWLGLTQERAANFLSRGVSSVEWTDVEPGLLKTGLIPELRRESTIPLAELAHLAAFFVTAAVTTSRDSIWLAIRGLVGNGEIVNRVCDDPALLPSLLNELHRLQSPVHALLRTARIDVETDDARIGKTDMVWISVAAANRDPSMFPEPDRIVLERQGNRHLSFGSGPHYCLGSHLGKLIGEAALAELLPMIRHSSFETNPPAPTFNRGSLPITWDTPEWKIKIR